MINICYDSGFGTEPKFIKACLRIYGEVFVSASVCPDYCYHWSKRKDLQRRGKIEENLYRNFRASKSLQVLKESFRNVGFNNKCLDMDFNDYRKLK